MSAEGDDAEEGEALDPAQLADKLNPQLLSACMRNDTDAATLLITQLADPRCEDHRQWSPMIWASNHGNDALTRLLISKGAAEVYKYDESQGKVLKKKHSPLHWAAFKGHLKVLWLLIAPPQSLSHHERDAIGNTPLHQAAAGGSLDCCECLMAQGVDVLAKNNRGHTPFALCTVPEVQELLKKAMECKACKATSKQFSATVMRYLCSWSLNVYCEAAVTQLFIYEDAFSSGKEKPVTWCTEVKDMVQEAERQLDHAMHLNQLETVTEALIKADDKPVDCQLVHKCRQVKAKLESEIQLGKAMQVQEVTNLDEFGAVHEELSQAIEDAELKNADPARVQAAKTLRRRLMSEASLMRAVQGPQKTTPGHITMLQELTTAAKAEAAAEDKLDVATKLIAKLTSERDVQKRVAETAPLCKLSSWKDAAGKGGELPSWSTDTEKFEAFHEDYKNVVELAEKNEISKELMDRALEQLASAEFLLMEKKQIEQENLLKTSKKKGKKK